MNEPESATVAEAAAQSTAEPAMEATAETAADGMPDKAKASPTGVLHPCLIASHSCPHC